MSIEIRFVGGPADGRTYAIPDDVPPRRYLIPVIRPLAEMRLDIIEPALTGTAEYDQMREGGGPRRADDGVYLYQYRVPPVTPEERQVLEKARRDAEDREQRRAAELDATWQEIRRERPQYPCDWRDL